MEPLGTTLRVLETPLSGRDILQHIGKKLPILRTIAKICPIEEVDHGRLGPK